MYKVSFVIIELCSSETSIVTIAFLLLLSTTSHLATPRYIVRNFNGAGFMMDSMRVNVLVSTVTFSLYYVAMVHGRH